MQTAKSGNCPGTLGDVNPLRNKGLRFPPRRKLASKRVQNTTLGAIAQKNTSIYQWVGVPGQLRIRIISRFHGLSIRGCPIEFYLFPSRLCVHVNHNHKLQYANSDKVITE